VASDQPADRLTHDQKPRGRSDAAVKPTTKKEKKSKHHDHGSAADEYAVGYHENNMANEPFVLVTSAVAGHPQV
jgi:hypothetical protein